MERAVASLVIRDLDDRVKEKIRLRAAKSGHSMEEEARRLLSAAAALPPADEVGLGTAIRQRFESVGPFKLQPFPSGRMRKPPKFK
jgi:plasmid stability protein